MRQAAAARAESRRVGATAVGVLVLVVAGVSGVLAEQSASSATVRTREPGAATGVALSAPSPPSVAPSPDGVPRSDRTHSALDGASRVTEEDGALPDGARVFDDVYPGIAKLDRKLREAVREASIAAAADDIAIYINSGWRSASYQDALFRQAVSQYGSAEEAARWVARAETSPHVAGDAVDIEPAEALAWLSSRGAEWGLCQIYRNEPWHYELRGAAIDGRCPPMYADPTRDSRMQQ
jgi:hypothetical protein